MTDALARERKAHIWDRHPDDWYVEESWCSERLFASDALAGCKTVLDPACGLGRIVHSAAMAGLRAGGSDIAPRWRGQPHQGLYRVANFLTGPWPTEKHSRIWAAPDAIVSNPPFKYAEQFVTLALLRARKAVAMLLPSEWIQGDRRSRWHETQPLAAVLYLTPRPSMPPGPVIQAGVAPSGGTKDFAFYVWRIGHRGPPMVGWLRKREPIRDPIEDDYPDPRPVALPSPPLPKEG